MINLLPWREVRRERLTRRFYTLLVLTLLSGATLGGAIAFYYYAELEAQQQRNDFIRQQISQLDADIRRVSEFKSDADELSERLASYQNLQNARGATVALFNDISASMADGVVYQRLARNAQLLSVTAEAGTDRQVSEQLRRVAGEQRLGTPSLSEVEREADSSRRLFRFEVRQTEMASGNEEADNEN
jgi:type IV pilus assembly protein PilN